jgi:hypothetical protein
MKMNIKKSIVIIISAVCACLLLALIIINIQLKITIDKQNIKHNILVSLGENDITENVIQFHNDNVQKFCVSGNKHYEINGNSYNLASNEYYYSSSPISGETLTFDQLLARDRLTKEQFYYFTNFINKYPGIKCISEDVNIKYNNGNTNIFAVALETSSYEGYLYISDGSIENNINSDYISKTFTKLVRIADTNWYEYRYKNEYGIY